MSAVDPVLVSRRLAYVLRHDPASVGLALDTSGWVVVSTLLDALARHGMPLTEAQLEEVIAHGTKRRFVVSGGRIRAVHGHSIGVDLGILPVTPPAVLYHGTVRSALPAILRDGLLPRTRQHVHLSADVATAREVAARHGTEIVVLCVDTVALVEAGQTFYPSTSGIWLTGPVDPRALTILSDASSERHCAKGLST